MNRLPGNPELTPTAAGAIPPDAERVYFEDRRHEVTNP